MQTLLATVVIFLAVVAAMATGVVLSGRRLRGSCGGVPGDDCSCSAADRKACAERAVEVERSAGDDSHRHLEMYAEGTQVPDKQS
ncbi:MAG: hypothetical protein OEZ06_27715 [Myxococcales bacterium]|nr:hypothetical protein [Myxococcales bacterium]